MTKKIGLALIIFFSLAVVLLILLDDNIPKWVSIILSVSSCAIVPFGASLLIINSKGRLVKRIYLIVALFLVAFGFISKFMEWPGAAVELIVGILWFCFAYSPVELKHKYQKWLPFSKTKFESLLLSSLDFVGITALAIGIMFKIQRWPMANFLQSTGVFVLLVGLIAWNFKFKKEVVRRKEAEDKIHELFTETQDSINYAKRIQSAILPSNRLMKEALPESFILYKPKDIVAGDFYWIEKKSDNLLIAVCDCTGHGVPGAMVSVVCNNALNRTVREYGLNEPAKILDKTRDIVIEEFDKADDVVKDGMDISLCSISNGGNTLQWAGANNPLWIIRKETGLLEEIKADKQPIGKYATAFPFNNHDISVKNGDMVYLFTDGYQDQFGGDKGKKFKASALKELLVNVFTLSMEEQKQKIEISLENWKGKLEQIDDICLIGFRI